MHSAALRRLAAKTQVHGPGADDFVRNRLTHSLEVAQIGRELGQAIGCDPDLVDAACLAHDLGHPPFGHNGEHALDEFAAACGGFEGNAQTLRVLTRLEAKAFHADGRPAGLNLTRAALDAAMKYPWPRGDLGPGTKFGAYDDDADVFAWVRSGAPEGLPCLEAQVMDLADDVAYSVHDFEDGIQAGQIQPAELSAERDDMVTLAQARYAPGVDRAALLAAYERLCALPYWPRDHDGSRRASATLKTTTSQLIGRFCSAVESATKQRYGDAPLARYAASLVVPDDIRHEIAVLKGVAGHLVMFTAERTDGLLAERDLLLGLAERLLAGAPSTIDPAFREDWDEARDDAARRRVVVDQVASLTDPSAVALARHLDEPRPAGYA
jgi:dGTPase